MTDPAPSDRRHAQAPKRVAVLMSGRGSNFSALLDASRQPGYPARIALAVANRPDSAGLAAARRIGLPCAMLDHTGFANRGAFDSALDAVLRLYRIELVCLAGFMRLLTPWFVERWHDRILNIHPSLLPAFKGAHAHRDALAAGVRFTGATVHMVRADMDSGPILAQSVVPVFDGDNEATLAERVLATEHRLYPHALALVADGLVRVSVDTATVDAAPPAPTALFNPVPPPIPGPLRQAPGEATGDSAA